MTVPGLVATVELLDSGSESDADDGLLALAGAAAQVFTHHTGQHVDPRWRITTGIPRQVGLAGSSAVVVGAIEALGEDCGVDLHPDEVASLALRAEAEVLGIPAGLQDRVVQSRRGLVFMEFSPGAMRSIGGLAAGRYTELDRQLLPPLLVAWRVSDGESSAIPHSDLRDRADSGDPEVLSAMELLARAARACAADLVHGGAADIGRHLRRSVELRESMIDLDPRHRELLDAAHAVEGVCANYAGSGGAIVAVGSPEQLLAADVALRRLGSHTMLVE